MTNIQVTPSVKHDEYIIANYCVTGPYHKEGFAVMPDEFTLSSDEMCECVIDAILDSRHDFRSMGVYKLVKVDPKEVANLVNDYLTSPATDEEVYSLVFDKMNEGSNVVVEPTDEDVVAIADQIANLVRELANDIGRSFSR